jgi:hypothetical protein
MHDVDASSSEQLPALFWDENPEDAENHPDYAALKALEGEMTLEERAASFKACSQICSAPVCWMISMVVPCTV